VSNLFKKLCSKLRRIFGYLSLQVYRVIFYKIISDIPLKAKFHQPVFSVGKGRLEVCETVEFGVVYAPGFYSGYGLLDARASSSLIRIGHNTKINNCITIVSNEYVTIGKDCLIGDTCRVFDSDFHALDPHLRHVSGQAKSSGVSIGDNVFIGSGVTILKGAVIGSDSVIGAGSVVVGNIPKASLASGNPCRVIRTL
jgi:acetyltransferase-like isoleucine patch superfamily enzyme